jgi:AraC family transcriptional regulator of adaptative response/methylated-DNA-[protein]-cysteine methyltransferase
MTEQRRWQAVLERDKSAANAFVYAVVSTGIYCRPSCASRQPKRTNVRFFDESAGAEKAGFRPCKRCRPQQAAAADKSVEAATAVAARLRELMAEDTEDRPTLAALAEWAGLSPFHLQRTFRRVMGITPRQYWDVLRRERLKGALREGVGVAAATYEAGYGSSSRVYERSDNELGMTPAAYARGGAGMRIRYVLAESPFGPLLVAATARGICAVRLGEMDDPAGFLAAEYPGAEITADDGRLGQSVVHLLGYLQGDGPNPDLPVDLKATAFQQQVWQALREIPRGETRTYGDVAEAIGRPKAVRAVARACADNPVALVIPCHRVIGRDGTLRGYRWGLERKQALLAAESA